MAKILLVRVRSDKYNKPYGAPPLGLLYLAAVLRQNHGDEVKIIDMRADCLNPEDVLRDFDAFGPDLVGLSSFTLERGMLHRVAGTVKQRRPGCPVAVGGPHANAFAEDILNDPNIDYVVLGEGEQTFPELIDAAVHGRCGSETVNGILFRRDGQTVKTASRPLQQNLDALPFPAWDLVDVKKYFALPRFMPFAPKGQTTPYMPIMTSRGCPYLCTYCHNIAGKKFRARSAGSVFAEMQALNRIYGLDDFEIIDDCFNLDKKRVLAICDLILNSGMKVKLSFPNGLRGDVLDDEVLERMRRAGTILICFAPETGSPRMQKLIKKNVNLEKLQRMISKAVDLGIHAHGFFMLGFPTETQEDLRATERFIAATRLHTADFFIVNLFPGTEMHALARELGKKVPEKFEDIDYHDTNYNASEIETKDLVAAQKKFFLMFYTHPLRALRIFSSPLVKKRYLFYYFGIFFRRVVLRKRES